MCPYMSLCGQKNKPKKLCVPMCPHVVKIASPENFVALCGQKTNQKNFVALCVLMWSK